MIDQVGKQNTDRELWREHKGDYYAPSLHVTQGGGIGINVGGRVIVMPVREWHAHALKASAIAPWICKAQPTADPPQDCDWPNCGCDPHASEVIECLIESGWAPEHEARRMREQIGKAHELLSAVVEQSPEIAQSKAFVQKCIEWCKAVRP